MNKRAHTLWIAAGVLLLASSSLHAGTRYLYSVSLTSTSFGGSLGTARNSPDDNQYIFCWVQGDDDSRMAYCAARDAARNARTCRTEAAPMVETIAALDGDGSLYVNFDAAGNCTAVTVTKGSFYEPKL